MKKAIVEVEAAIRAGDLRDALTEAVEAWGQEKSASLAGLVSAISERASEGRPPLSARRGNTQQAQFLGANDEGHPADVPLLLAAIPQAANARFAAERIQALSSRPADPRVSAAVVEWLVRPPFPGTAGRVFVPALLRLLAHSDDPACLAPLAALAAAAALPNLGKAGAAAFVLRPLGRSVIPKIAATHGEISARWPHGPPASTLETTAFVDKLQRALAGDRPRDTRDEASLLAEIHANPSDDEPRLVYADLLIERGDPRGELIRLQCARALTAEPPSRREKELVSKFGRAWLSDLESAVLKDGLAYERGFLAACRYGWSRTTAHVADATFIGDPRWSTLHTLDLSSCHRGGVGAQLAAHPVMRSLSTLVGAYAAVVSALVDAGNTTVRTLETRTYRNLDFLPALTRGEGLLGLLDLDSIYEGRWSVEQVAALLESRCGQRLRSLAIWIDPEVAREVVDAARASVSSGSTLERMVLAIDEPGRVGRGARVRLVRGDAALDRVDVVAGSDEKASPAPAQRVAALLG
ncbi:MAG: TIGR02996 domain-containing protein [Polyangiaceae bacterium]